MGIFHNIIRYSSTQHSQHWLNMAIFAPWHLGSQPTQQSPWLAMVLFQGGCTNGIAIETPETPNLNVSSGSTSKWSDLKEMIEKMVFVTFFLWNTFEISFDGFFVLLKSIKTLGQLPKCDLCFWIWSWVYQTRLDHGHSKLYNLDTSTESTRHSCFE